LKCNKCGKIVHTDEKSAALVKELIKNGYDFEMDKSTTILFGSCASCN
jgi:Fe2+/Zn2+ uptake regulation proteins